MRHAHGAIMGHAERSKAGRRCDAVGRASAPFQATAAKTWLVLVHCRDMMKLGSRTSVRVE